MYSCIHRDSRLRPRPRRADRPILAAYLCRIQAIARKRWVGYMVHELLHIHEAVKLCAHREGGVRRVLGPGP